MKKMYKRIISLTMALIMTLSFSMVAFASETNENVNVLTKEISTDSISPASIPPGYGDLTGIISGTSNSTTLRVPFTVPQGGAYIYFIVGTRTRMYLTTKTSSGITYSGDVVNASDSNQRILLHSRNVNRYWQAGDYVLEVSFQETGKLYAFNVFASEYILD